MRLRDCAPGAIVRLRSLAAEPGRRLRLIELGLVPGRWLRVMTRGATGGLVVAVGDTRIALDTQTSASLVVAEA